MGCNCGKNKGKGYVVNYPDGTQTKVSSLSQAVSVARRVGGNYVRET